jgi:hypothetical protein
VLIKTGERNMRTSSTLTIHNHHIPFSSPHAILEKINKIKIAGVFHKTVHLMLIAILAAAMFTMTISICARLHDAKMVASYLEASPLITYMYLE